MDFIEKCRKVSFRIQCLECSLEIETPAMLRQHIAETNRQHLISSLAHSNPVSLFYKVHMCLHPRMHVCTHAHTHTESHTHFSKGLFIPCHRILVGYYGFMLVFHVSVYPSVCHSPSVFSFPDDDLSECQWIFAKLVCALI